MTCPRCIKRGKTWQGSDPRCAFENPLEFDTDNWACATLGHLRHLLIEYEKYDWSDDQYLGLTAIGPGVGSFVVVGWYKSRGRTELCVRVDEENVCPASLDDVERAIAELEKAA